MNTDVGGVPVGGVWKEDDIGLLGRQHTSDCSNRCIPPRGIALASLKVDPLQAGSAEVNQAKANGGAGRLQLHRALRPTIHPAPERHRDIDHGKSLFTHQAQRQRARNDFVVGMRRKY